MKRNLNSDGQQFHQYKQKEHMMSEIQDLAWNRHKNVAGLCHLHKSGDQLMRILTDIINRDFK